MRYDTQDRLEEWKARGTFPKIHDALFALVVEEARGASFCDLCCSIGLLGQRILEKVPGSRVVGVEMDTDALLRGTAAGIRVPRHQLKVTPETVERFAAILRENGVTVLVARRCLSELFAADQRGEWFTEAVLAAGVREFFIQGRQVVPNATHPVPDVRAEIACLGQGLKVRILRGECAYLVPR